MTEKDCVRKKEVTLDFDLDAIGDAQETCMAKDNPHWSTGNFLKIRHRRALLVAHLRRYTYMCHTTLGSKGKK